MRRGKGRVRTQDLGGTRRGVTVKATAPPARRPVSCLPAREFFAAAGPVILTGPDGLVEAAPGVAGLEPETSGFQGTAAEPCANGGGARSVY